MVHGPSEGLSILESAESALKGHHHVDAVRAHLLELSGEQAASLPERDHLTKKAAELRSGNR
jgi:predicted RNA polymerase sigma factor